jgi:hypothetical protein
MVALFAQSAQAAGGGASVSGVVRDVQGVAQMGALVQLMSGGALTVATAFTDSHGRYTIANLSPGRYLVRASATLFVPATRSNLQVRTGAVTVVNLTLAAVYDTASWLPAVRRRADEPDDDWKWTLRSSANRPILRMVEDGSLIEVSTSATETRGSNSTQARETVASGDGEFGSGGVHNILSIHREMAAGGELIVRSDVGSTRESTAYGPSQQIQVGFGQRRGFDGASRMVVSYEAHPELVTATSTAGIQTFSISSAKRMNLAGVVDLEAGGTMQVVNVGAIGVVSRPFVRVTGHPIGVWTLHYRMATDRTTQGFDSVTTGQDAVPVTVTQRGRVAVESGRHQEFGVDRRTGRGTVSLAYFRDSLGQTAVGGGGLPGMSMTDGVHVPVGMTLDPATGTFRALTSGYKTNGARLTVSTPLVDGLWVAAEYSIGSAIASETGPGAQYGDALAGLMAESAQAGSVAVKGRIKGSGTRVRASYRWQPARFVTPVDAYGSFSDQAFFSCQVRQPIQWGMRLPKGMDATIDVTNLLAQGYRPFLSADGQTLFFAQATRAVQGGVSFTF